MSTDITVCNPGEAVSRFEGSRRAVLSEWMDEPCSYADLRGCLVDLARVNRITLAHRPTLQWLEQVVRRVRPAEPLHIVDVGCGGGDLLRRIERWALRRRVRVRLTGVDRNPLAVRAAREFTSASSRIRWQVGEAESLTTSADVVISSLFTHHLADGSIVRFVEWMERVARVGWFINDLYRSRISYRAFRWLAAGLRLHPFVRHDGPISILRAFVPADWTHYVAAAGLSGAPVRIARSWPGRLCAGRIREL